MKILTSLATFHNHLINLPAMSDPFAYVGYTVSGIASSRTLVSHFPHLRTSMVEPYPSPQSLISRVNEDSVEHLWFDDTFGDVHDEDFLWATSMQSARMMSQRIAKWEGHHDCVLARLITLGISDQGMPPFSMRRDAAMRLAGAIGNRLWYHLERLRGKVRKSAQC